MAKQLQYSNTGDKHYITEGGRTYSGDTPFDALKEWAYGSGGVAVFHCYDDPNEVFSQEDFDAGYEEGFKDGHDDGYDKGHCFGHDEGYETGKLEGFDALAFIDARRKR